MAPHIADMIDLLEWANKLIGLRAKVPNRWWANYGQVVAANDVVNDPERSAH